MRLKLSCLLLACVAMSLHAESLTDKYADSGELIVTQLNTAPFPHPKRADGHKYGNQVFTAKDNYSDNTVAVFIPKGFRETGTIDFVVHFHGWKNNVAGVLSRYKLVEQLMASGRNAVLVVPQGPLNASDSFGGKLEDQDGFKNFMADVVATLRDKSELKKKDFAVGKIICKRRFGLSNF